MANADPCANSNATVTMIPRTNNSAEALLGHELNAHNDLTHCHFMKLSGELRNRIYREVLVEPDGEYVVRGYRNPGLLATCKEVRSEAMSIFYFENLFLFVAQAFNSELQFKFTEHLWASKSFTEKRLVRVCSYINGDYEPAWSNLLLWLKRVHSGNVLSGFPDPGNLVAAGSHYQTLYEHVICGMFATTRRLRCEVSWEVLEPILVAQRPSLIAWDERWAES